jgi:hypothetical protein
MFHTQTHKYKNKTTFVKMDSCIQFIAVEWVYVWTNAPQEWSMVKP